MFLYGVHRRPGDHFVARCLPAIIANGGEHPLVLTSERGEPADALADLVAQAADFVGFDALVVLGGDVEPADGFARCVRELLGPDPAPGMIGAVAHGSFQPSAGLALVLSPDVVHALAVDPAPLLGEDGARDHLDNLLAWMRRTGRHVVEAHLPLAAAAPAVPTIERLTQILAASRQGAWAETLEKVFESSSPLAPGRLPDGAGAAAETYSAPPSPSSDRLGLTGAAHDERPELLCHIRSDVRSVLVVAADPSAIAHVITSATGAEVTQVISTLDEPLSLTYRAPYDCILLVEALSHVRNPQRLLQDVVGVLAPGGQVIAALPNAKHWTHVLPLLLNDQMRYGGANLLDPGAPLRLFTLVEATALFDEAGLTTYDFCNGTRHPLADPPELETLLELHRTAGVNVDDARTLLTCYQYVFVTRTSAQSL